MAQWAAKMIGINENDLIERPMSFWRQQVADERQDPVTAEQWVKMRFDNYDSRRRHKIKVIFDFIAKNQTELECELVSGSRQLRNSLQNQSSDKYNGLIREKMDKDYQKYQALERVQNQIQDLAKQEVLHVDKIQKTMDKKKLRSMVSVVRADEKRKESINKNELRHSKN